MPRLMLTDELWSKLKPILLQFGIYNKFRLRKTFEGILYRLRTGIPWRDLPAYFGHWNSVFKCFTNWAKRGCFKKIFDVLKVEPDLEWGFIDGSYIKAHQHSASGQSDKQAIGMSRGGKTSKIHMVVDACGLPVNFEVTGGQVNDSSVANKLLSLTEVFKFTLADKGYDKESLREQLRDRGSIPLVPRRKSSRIGNEDMDWSLYKYRHLVENFFARIKHYRAIASRFDKLKRNYEASITLACIMAWLPM